MKRAGNLYWKIAEIENLELAFWKAQRGKSGKKEVKNFRSDLQNNLLKIRNELLSCNVTLGNYHYFTIYDPKERVICAANFRERVIQHAVVNICEPYFEKYQIFDSFACRKNKGVDACLARTQYFCSRFKWYIKFDVHKYFDSIDHKTLLNILDRRFKDPQLMNFFANLLDTYFVTPGRGLPIGNLLSQYFANLYLAVMDHKLKEVFKVPGFVRYMDDFILFSNDKSELIRMKGEVEKILCNDLKLELNPELLNRTGFGISFLSYRVLADKLRLTLKAKQRFCKKIKTANILHSAEKALPLLAFIQRADSWGFRQKLFFKDFAPLARTV